MKMNALNDNTKNSSKSDPIAVGATITADQL